MVKHRYCHFRYFFVVSHVLVPVLFLCMFLIRDTYSASFGVPLLQATSELYQVHNALSQVGPVLSTVLFILAGIFYAVGQMLPPDKKAQFHATAINIIIGAIVVAVLSVASTSLASASTHLISNFTSNSTNSL
ncbi:MAG: hypothetical protein M1504_03110 [Candidatus Marsarchaeota archaeon]|nr:hypothetical protein [Candidatus Marsarchaeota archaeon]